MGRCYSPGAHLYCVSRILTQAISLQIQRQILVFSRRKKGKEGEGETDRRWLSWAVIFWEPVLRLPGAIFKRPTSPHSPGGCRWGGEEGAYACKHGRSTRRRVTLRTPRGHPARPDQRPWGKAQPQRLTMLLISIHGPLLPDALLLPSVKETLPPIGDALTHTPRCQSKRVYMCHRVRVRPRASNFQIDWHTGSLRSAWELHAFFYFPDFHMEETWPWGATVQLRLQGRVYGYRM